MKDTIMPIIIGFIGGATIVGIAMMGFWAIIGLAKLLEFAIENWVVISAVAIPFIVPIVLGLDNEYED